MKTATVLLELSVNRNYRSEDHALFLDSGQAIALGVKLGSTGDLPLAIKLTAEQVTDGQVSYYDRSVRVPNPKYWELRKETNCEHYLPVYYGLSEWLLENFSIGPCDLNFIIETQT